MTLAKPAQGRYNGCNAPDCEPLDQIRASMRLAHENGLSWGKMAKLQGVTKGLAYRFAVEGYTPKDEKILARLQANHIDILIQVAHRDDAGRFVAGHQR